MRRMFCRRPAKMAREFSMMGLMSAGRGWAVGNSASAENWSTNDLILSTEEEMTSLERRMTAMEGDSTCAVARVDAEAIDVAADLLSR